MATLSSRPHTRQAVPIDNKQERAASLHPEGQYSMDQAWTECQVCS
jgi:hypothetical protein